MCVPITCGNWDVKKYEMGEASTVNQNYTNLKIHKRDCVKTTWAEMREGVSKLSMLVYEGGGAKSS